MRFFSAFRCSLILQVMAKSSDFKVEVILCYLMLMKKEYFSLAAGCLVAI